MHNPAAASQLRRRQSRCTGKLVIVLGSRPRRWVADPPTVRSRELRVVIGNDTLLSLAFVLFGDWKFRDLIFQPSVRFFVGCCSAARLHKSSLFLTTPLLKPRAYVKYFL